MGDVVSFSARERNSDTQLFENWLEQNGQKTTLEKEVAFAQSIYQQTHKDARYDEASDIVRALQETPLQDNLATRQGIHVDWLLDVFFQLPFLKKLMTSGCQMWFLRKVGINELLRRRKVHAGPFMEHLDVVEAIAHSFGVERPKITPTPPRTLDKATRFLSYTGRTRVDHFVDLLKNLRGEYVWFDVCCVDQFAWTGHKNSPQVRHFSDKLIGEIPELVETIGNTVLLLERWNDIPYTLNQAWLLWETWNTVQVKAEFSILMPSAEQEKFIVSIQQGYVNDVQAVLGEIKCGDAKSDDKHAVQTILAKMNQVGYYTVSCQVVGHVRQWFQSKGFDHLRSLASTSNDRLVFSNNFGWLLQEQGCFGEAESLLKDTMNDCRKVLGNYHLETFQSVSHYGRVLNRLGRYKEAESLYTRASAEFRQLLTDQNPSSLRFFTNWAELLDLQGRYDEAELLYRKSLATSRQVLGEKDPITLRLMNSSARNLRSQGRFRVAKPLAKAALELRRRVWGNEHPLTLRSKNTYAKILHDLGRDDAAELLFKITLDQRRRVLSDHHPDTLCTTQNYGLVLLDKRCFGEAELHLKEALTKRRLLRGEDHPETVRSLRAYGTLLLRKGCVKEARRHYQEANAKFRSALGDDHRDTVGSGNDLHDLRRLLRRQASDGRHVRRFLWSGCRALLFYIVFSDVVGPVGLFNVLHRLSERNVSSVLIITTGSR